MLCGEYEGGSTFVAWTAPVSVLVVKLAAYEDPNPQSVAWHTATVKHTNAIHQNGSCNMLVIKGVHASRFFALRVCVFTPPYENPIELRGDRPHLTADTAAPVHRQRVSVAGQSLITTPHQDSEGTGLT